MYCGECIVAKGNIRAVKAYIGVIFSKNDAKIR